MSTPKVWAIVLNHGQAETALRAVVSLRGVKYRSGRLTICVVDNGSGDDEVARLRAGAPLVLESGGNLGYAGGNNVGIRAALADGADAVWILNPDAEARPRSLEWMVRVLRTRDRAGIVGCRILEGSADFPTIQSQGGHIDWEAGGRSELMRRGERANHLVRGGVREVDFAPGAAWLIRREVFDDIGLLPEHYFMYFEETDFCVRAKQAGWKVFVTPWADVVHTSARAGSLPGEIYTYYFLRNRLVFGLEHTDLEFDDLLADTEKWQDGWRRRVERIDPTLLTRFDGLVAAAVNDARAARVGKRDDVG